MSGLNLSGSGSSSVEVSPERGAGEAARILWKSIEEARGYMEDSRMTLEEKRRWAKTLADMIGVYNKLLLSLGEQERADEDLGALLTRIPSKWRKTIQRRVQMWRKRSL